MKKVRLVAVLAGAMALLAGTAGAHCDSLSGPVVADARAALRDGKVEAVLKWVRPSDEAEVRKAFAEVMRVRTQGDAARELADRWFFETVVRLHRAGEGEPFTGLRPPDWKPPRLIALADEAVNRGTSAEIERALTEQVILGLRERLQRVVKAKEHAAESVEGGRAFVEAYTKFLHFVEELDSSATGPSVETEAHARSAMHK